MSILGYSLFPMLLLGVLGIVFKLQNVGGIAISIGKYIFYLAVSIWSSYAGCNFL